MDWLFDPTKAYKRAQIPPGETLLNTFTAGIRKFGISVSGAEIIVTDAHLIISPLDTEGAREILKVFAEIAKVPGIGDAIEKYEQTGLTEPIVIPRHTIQRAVPSGDGGLFTPPGIEITFTDGGTLDLGVLHSVFSPNIDPRNREARDDLLMLLQTVPEVGDAAGVEVPPQPASSGDIPDQIRKLAELREAGIVSHEEFEAKKTQLLNRM